MWEISAKKVMLTVAKLQRWAEIVAAGQAASQASTPADAMYGAGTPRGYTGAERATPLGSAQQWPPNGVVSGVSTTVPIPGTMDSQYCGGNATDSLWDWGNETDMFAGLDNNFWFEGLQEWTTNYNQAEMPR